MLNVVLTVFFLLFVNQSFSGEQKNSVILSQKSQEILEKINKNLEKMTDLKVSFRQKMGEKEDTGFAEFKSGHGIFIKYKTLPITLMTNKDVTAYYDSKVDQKSEIPTKDSATKIFTGFPQINGEMFDISSVSENDEAYFVVATVKRMKAEGIITMYFSKNDFILRRMDIKSPDGQFLRLDLYSHDFKTISPERFKAINIKKENLE